MSGRRAIAAAGGGLLLGLLAAEAVRFVVECVAILTSGAELGEPDA